MSLYVSYHSIIFQVAKVACRAGATGPTAQPLVGQVNAFVTAHVEVTLTALAARFKGFRV